MSKEELRPFEKEFIDKTTGVLAKYKSIKDDEAYTYDPEHIDGVELINFRSVGDPMVETTEILNLIIAPIWAKNGEFTEIRPMIGRLLRRNLKIIMLIKNKNYLMICGTYRLN